MKRLWNQNNEAKALLVSTFLTVLGFGGTAFLFWFHRHDIPLGVLLGGVVSALSWLVLYLVKRSDKPHHRIDIIVIYTRLALIVTLSIVFAVLGYQFSLVIVSPIYLVVSYFIVSIISMIVYFKKGE